MCEKSMNPPCAYMHLRPGGKNGSGRVLCNNFVRLRVEIGCASRRFFDS
jgi:hypothetical protein